MPDDNSSLPALTSAAEAPAILPSTMSPAMEIMLNDKLFERAKLIAKYISEAEGFTPPHLLKKTGACFAVVTRAITWKLDPYAVAQCTYETPGGKVGFEGKLCQAILENSGKLVGPVRYQTFGTVVVKLKSGRQQTFTTDESALEKALEEGATEVSRKDWSAVRGKFQIVTSDKGKQYAKPTWTRQDAQGIGVVVRAQVRGEDEPRELRFFLEQAFPLNSTLWATDPETQIKYAAVRRFGSVAAPGLFMGVPFDREDFDPAERARDVTPPPRPKRSDFAESTAAGTTDVEAPAAEEAQPAQEPFAITTADGEVLNFDGADHAVAALADHLTEAEKKSLEAIDGIWESNGFLLTQLRERGLSDRADSLAATYADLVAKRKQAQAAAQTKPAAEAEPPSPLKDRKAEWPPRVAFLKKRIAGMGPQERTDFMEKDKEVAFIRDHRTTDYDALLQIHHEKQDEERG